jgi:hypothetical protein
VGKSKGTEWIEVSSIPGGSSSGASSSKSGHGVRMVELGMSEECQVQDIDGVKEIKVTDGRK